MINHLKRVHNKGDPNKRRRESSDDEEEDGDRPPSAPESILKKQLKRMREQALPLERHTKSLGE